MKKMLMTLGVVGALAVPGGVALAQHNSTDPSVPVITVEQERVRDQLQLTTQTRDQTRARVDQGICDEDCAGDQTRERARDQVQLDDGAGTATRSRAYDNSNG
ncbi:MAG: hypothetical protein HY828_12210 [Actinobacteria bacterium]|nr:hypothetical protein [Actinomycetota bacterium]